MIIGRCTFTSPVPILAAHIFWLKDGKQIFSGLSDPTETEIGYIFPDLIFNKANFTNEGFYQCAILMKDVMSKPVLSNNITVVVEG